MTPDLNPGAAIVSSLSGAWADAFLGWVPRQGELPMAEGPIISSVRASTLQPAGCPIAAAPQFCLGVRLYGHRTVGRGAGPTPYGPRPADGIPDFLNPDSLIADLGP